MGSGILTTVCSMNAPPDFSLPPLQSQLPFHEFLRHGDHLVISRPSWIQKRLNSLPPCSPATSTCFPLISPNISLVNYTFSLLLFSIFYYVQVSSYAICCSPYSNIVLINIFILCVRIMFTAKFLAYVQVHTSNWNIPTDGLNSRALGGLGIENYLACRFIPALIGATSCKLNISVCLPDHFQLQALLYIVVEFIYKSSQIDTLG